MSKVTRPVRDVGIGRTRVRRNESAGPIRRLIASQVESQADQAHHKSAFAARQSYRIDVQPADSQHKDVVKSFDSQAKDIVPGDLKATLEAHRKANRERYFRKFALDAKEPHLNGAQASSDCATAHRAIRRVMLERPLEARSASPIETIQQTGPRNRHTYLNERMEKFTNWMQIKPIEADLREAIALELIAQLRGAVSDVEFRIFGSQQTNLAHPLSDIDVGFHIPSLVKTEDQRGPSESLSRTKNRKLVIDTLRKIHEAISLLNGSEAKYINVKLIGARFPLLKLQHAPSGLDMQIVFQKSQSWDQMLCSNYLTEFELLKPLYLFMRATITARTPLSTQAGGPGSYPLFMMIVAWFKLHPWAIYKDLPDLLLGFLDFYGHFNTEKQGISISPLETFAKIGPGNLHRSAAEKSRVKEDPILRARHRIGQTSKTQPWLLCLQDPANPSNDLGKHIPKIVEVQALFRRLHAMSTAWLTNSPRDTAKNDLVGFFLLGFPDLLRVQRVRLWEALESDWGARLLEQHRDGVFCTDTAA